MFCPNCGHELSEGSKFCANCGNPVPEQAAAPAKAASAPQQPVTQSAPAQQPVYQQPVPRPQAAASTAVYTQQPIARTNTNTVTTQGPFQKPAEYRNLGVFALFQFVSIGLYYLYNIVRMTKATNLDDRYARRSPAGWLILSILFWPCHWYWLYKTGKILDDMAYKRTGRESSTAVAALILGFFQLGFIAMILFQDRLNKAVGGATGSAPYSHGVGTCSNCGAEFPDDVQNCPKCGTAYKRPFSHTNAFPFVIIALGFLVLILIIALIAAAV